MKLNSIRARLHDAKDILAAGRNDRLARAGNDAASDLDERGRQAESCFEQPRRESATQLRESSGIFKAGRLCCCNQ